MSLECTGSVEETAERQQIHHQCRRFHNCHQCRCWSDEQAAWVVELAELAAALEALVVQTAIAAEVMRQQHTGPSPTG